MAFPIEHHICNLLVQLIQGVLQAFIQLVRHKVGLISPPLQTLRNQVVSKALELLVGVLHLVVLRVEQHRLLYLLNVALVQNVFADTQLLDAEVRLQGVTDGITTSFVDPTVEDL